MVTFMTKAPPWQMIGCPTEVIVARELANVTGSMREVTLAHVMFGVTVTFPSVQHIRAEMLVVFCPEVIDELTGTDHW